MSNFVDVDAVKNYFDIATHLPNGKYKTKAKLANDSKGFKEFDAWFNKHVEPVVNPATIHGLHRQRVTPDQNRYK
jgi:hypothetical protein